MRVVLSCFGHLENTGSQSYLDLLNVNTHFIVKEQNKTKSYPLTSPENSFNYWKAVRLIGADTSCPKFWFLFKSSNFEFVFLKGRSFFVHNFRKCLLNAHLWVAIVCLSVILSSKMDFPWKKLVVQLTSNTFKHCTYSFPVF